MKKIVLLAFFYLFVGITLGIAQSNYIEEIATITGNTTVFGIGLKGPYLYVNPGSSSIKIYDLSTPSSPVSVGQIAYATDFAYNLDVFGNYLYIYGGPDHNLLLFDIADPISPNELGLLNLPPSGNGIWHAAHLSNYSYMTAKDTIYVINTLDKSAPFIENKISYSPAGTYGLRDIYATSEVLYIGVGDGILIYDNSTLFLPVFHSIYPNGRLSLAVDSTAHRLFTAQTWSSDYTHDVSNISDAFSPNLIFQGTGGSAPSGKLVSNDEILIQSGADNGNQAVSFYKIEEDTSIYIEDFLGSIEYSITDMDAIGSLYIIAKNGGIEILKYNDSIPDEPAITVIPNTISFENTCIGESSTKSIMVSNVGLATLEVTDISSSIDVFTVDLTSFTIEPGNTQELTITFTPDDEGFFGGLLEIENNDPENSTMEVSVSGMGIIASPGISVLPGEIIFDTTLVGETSTEILTISNTGLAMLEVTDILSSNSAFTMNLFSFDLEPDETQEIEVTFSPNEQMMYEGTLQIESNDPLGTFEVPLSGYGDLDTYAGNEMSTHLVQIFPNPINDILFVKNVDGYEIIIYDLFGNSKLRRICKSDIEQINVSGLSTGIYLIRIISKERIIIKRIEVIR